MWETMKAEIRGTTVKYSKNRNKQSKIKLEKLEKELSKLEQAKNSTNVDETSRRIQTLEAELNNIYAEEKKTAFL